MVSNTVSVLMAVYNSEPFLKETINSVLNQTYYDFEFIIIDDCSTDKTKDVIKGFDDKRIRYYKNGINLGLTKSLNIGFKYCRGKYIARMDSDDICEPTRLAQLVESFSKDTELDVCGSWIKFFGKIHFYSTKRMKFPTTHEEIFIYGFFKNPIAHPSVMFKTSAFNADTNLYDENYPRAQDYVLWGNMLLQGFRFANIPKNLLKYRLSENQISNMNKKDQEQTSNFVREKLIKQLISDCSSDNLTLHNSICNFETCFSWSELMKRKEWLELLTRNLNSKFPANKRYIKKLLSFYWFISCLSLSKGFHISSFWESSSLFSFSTFFNKNIISYSIKKFK